MTVSGTALEVPGHLPPRSTHSNMLLINITNAKSKSPSVSRDPSPCNSKGADSLCISNVASSYYDSSDVGSPSSEISTPRLGETTSHHDPIAISILCCDSEPENMDTDIGSPQLAITGKKSNIYAEGGIIKSSNLSPTNKVSTNNSPLLIGMYSDAVESKDKSQTRKRNKAAMSPKNSLTISTGADAEEVLY